MNKTRTLMVTGGAGFIGSNFIRHWIKNHPEDKVINFDALTYAGNIANLADVKDNPNYVFIEGDITDEAAVNQAMNGVDIVVHFAAESHVDRSILDPHVFVKTNILGTHVLLNAALKNKVARFHHVSTDEVFGSLKLGSELKFTESTPYDPRSPYSASKAGSDHLVRAYYHTYGLPVTITNCSNNYGEYHHPEKVIPLAITNILEDKPVPVYGDGRQVRDWLYVQDHAKAIEKVLLHGQVGETYLVGGLVKDVSNLELVKLILKIMNKPETLIKFVKDRPGHDERYAVDWSKINLQLDWQPAVTLEEGLTQTINWYIANKTWWEPLKVAAKDFFSQNYQEEK